MAKKTGRPAFQASQEQKNMVKAMVGFGIPVEDICKVIENPATGKPIDKKTAYRHFREEIESGHVLATFKVAKNLFNIATGSTPQAITAAIFYLKCQGGWSEKGKAEGDAGIVEPPTEIRIIGGPGRGTKEE
jgi:hypothetical protein